MDLKALKERKRKLLMDAQLIKNRCNLLEQENQKTWKTIEESKKRAQEVLLNKARIEHDAVQKYQLSTIRDQDRRERQERIQQTKQPKGFGANYLMKLKHDKFRLEKQIKSENRQARSTIQREHMRQGRVRSLDARLNKPRAEERQRLIQEAKSNMVHRDKNRRLDEETYHCDQSHREIQEFEYLEVEMAKRLAYSQQLHQHTLDHVEQSLNILNIQNQAQQTRMDQFFELNDYLLSSLPTYVEHAVLRAPFQPYSLSILLTTLVIGIFMLLISYTIEPYEPSQYIPPKPRDKNRIKKWVSWADLTEATETSPELPKRKWQSPMISKKVIIETVDYTQLYPVPVHCNREESTAEDDWEVVTMPSKKRKAN